MGYIINEENKHKFIKEEISETNDESVSDKFKNIYKNEIKKKVLDINKKSQEDKNCLNEEDNLNNEILKNQKKKNKINKTVELNDIIKNANIFSNKINLNINLDKKFEYAYALDKYIQNEIKSDKNNNLITPNEAMYYLENNIIRFFGYFGSETSYRNINTFIEKTPTNDTLREISFKILASGLATQKVYKLIIQNEELKGKIDEEDDAYDKYFQDLKIKISNEFNILEDDIYFFSPNYNKYEINLIIYNKTIEGFEEFLKAQNLKYSTSLLLNNIILSPCIFEEHYCKLENEWTTKRNSIRGGKKYFPPHGWYGISLKTLNKYNRKSSVWLGKQNINGEWPVAYHAIGNGNVFDKILDILNGNLKNEETKIYKNYNNTENTKNKYPYCGEGIYCCPEINDVEKLADKTSFGFYNTKFQFVLMVRVNPNKIRSPNCLPVCWILSGNEEEIRPYRLLFKICAN